jgi:hypothetical protein
MLTGLAQIPQPDPRNKQVPRSSALLYIYLYHFFSLYFAFFRPTQKEFIYIKLDSHIGLSKRLIYFNSRLYFLSLHLECVSELATKNGAQS